MSSASYVVERYLEDTDDDNEIRYGWTATEEGISSYFVIFLSLLALVLILSKFLHDFPKLGSLLPEAGMTIIVGLIAGAFVHLSENQDQQDDDGNENKNAFEVAEGLLAFSSTTFFSALLPPIIFSSGYHLKKELFFRHIKPIVLYSCLGTLLSTFVVAIVLHGAVYFNLTGGFKPFFSECLTFGALISATDPVSTLAVFQQKKVDPQLFYLVFGESVLNDAVGLVLFNAFSKFVGQEENTESVAVAALSFVMDFAISFVGSVLFGLLSGLLAAYLLKVIDMRQTRMLELSLYVLVMYLPHFCAEVLHLSGIVTILFTGISARRYATLNLSLETESDADALFRVTAHLAETAIFLELGLSVFGLAVSGHMYIQFILWACLGCLLGRALNIYPITWFFNRSLKSFDACLSPENLAVTYEDMQVNPEEADMKIDMNTTHMLWYSGLRGAVAYACAKNFPDVYGNRWTFVITTMVIVQMTVFLLGSTTECFLKRLKIDLDIDEEKYMEEQSKEVRTMGPMKTFDNKYICPYVIRNFADKDKDKSVLQQELMTVMSELSEDRNNRLSGHQIEMTILEHEDILKQMGYCRVNYMKRKSSVYDYGF